MKVYSSCRQLSTPHMVAVRRSALALPACVDNSRCIQFLNKEICQREFGSAHRWRGEGENTYSIGQNGNHNGSLALLFLYSATFLLTSTIMTIIKVGHHCGTFRNFSLEIKVFLGNNKVFVVQAKIVWWMHSAHFLDRSVWGNYFLDIQWTLDIICS